MGPYKCENSECGHLFKSNNPISCPQCDSLEFSTISIKSNLNTIIIGFIFLLIGTSLYFFKDSFHKTDIPNSFTINVNENTCERVIIGFDNLSTNYSVSINRNEGYTIGKMYWNNNEINNNEVFYIKNLNSKEIIELTIPKCKLNESKYVLNNNEENKSKTLNNEKTSDIRLSVKNDLTLDESSINNSNNIKIGDELYGGIIFYIDQSKRHGLVAAPYDLIGKYSWGCTGEEILGADFIKIGFGSQNTLDIVSSCDENNNAASKAISCNINGYNDWYLPSKNELFYMYKNLKNSHKFNPDFYWSSSERNYDNSWTVSFNSGLETMQRKKNLNYVRLVRSF